MFNIFFIQFISYWTFLLNIFDNLKVNTPTKHVQTMLSNRGNIRMFIIITSIWISTQGREMTKKCTSDGLAISSNFDGSDIFLSAHFVRIRLWELEEFQRNRVLYRHIISM